MTDVKELVERLWASDEASALTNEAARALEALSRDAQGVAEPVAWEYELSGAVEHAVDAYGKDIKIGHNWSWRLTKHKPCVPAYAIRNLTPLYASPLSTDDIRRQALEEAAKVADQYLADCDPIQGIIAAGDIAIAIRSLATGGRNE
jgi:hypothetical protein